MGELELKKDFVTLPMEYPPTALARKADYEKMIRAQQTNTLASLKRKEDRLKIQIAMIDPTDVEEFDKLEDQLSEVKSKTLRAEYDLNADVELPLTEEEKGEWRQNQNAYGERINKHLLNQQKVFAIIIGQCTQRLQDKLHDDP